MENIFIGWSGNRSLADELASIINLNSYKKAIVGGGMPRDMYIGAQVIGQINRSNFAVLLVEDKEDGKISSNLMFEWGYIMAKLSVDNLCTILINKSPRDLPSDLLGTWVFEVQYDRNVDDEHEKALEIFDIVEKSFAKTGNKKYFDYINNWKQIFPRLTDDIPETSQELCEYIVFGCLAAYYYMDNKPLRKVLDNLSGSLVVNEYINFAKSYIEVFLDSANMTKAISQDSFFRLIQTFESVLSGHQKVTEELDQLLDILCYDAYGLTCSLFLKNDNLDSETITFCSQKAKECFENALEKTKIFESGYKKDSCLIQLLYSYFYNDLGHLYHNVFGDKEKFLEYLTISVEQRKKLHQTFTAQYPSNIFLSTKFEQEYIIALSEQCNYMEESFIKTMCQKTIISKFEEWQKELVYTSSLTDRIKDNIKKF